MKIRPVSVTVQVEAVLDDGENLTPVAVAPIRLNMDQFARFDLAAQIADLQGQLDAGAQS